MKAQNHIDCIIVPLHLPFDADRIELLKKAATRAVEKETQRILQSKELRVALESINGTKIKSLRESKGWTLQELGDRVGLDKSAIFHLENRKSKFQTKTIIRLLEALDSDLLARLLKQ